MKRLAFLIFLIILAPKISFSQEVKKPVENNYKFNPAADAKKDLADAMVAAKKNHTRVLVVVGGDWSAWCRQLYTYLKFHRFLWGRFELVCINFSPDNKNTEIRQSLSVPADRGYPILMVLDENGQHLITTDTDNMKSALQRYDRDKVNDFLNQWAAPSTTK